MSDDDVNLASVLRALLSVGDVTLTKIPVHSPFVTQVGYRLDVLHSSIVIDGQHAQPLTRCGIAIIEEDM